MDQQVLDDVSYVLSSNETSHPEVSLELNENTTRQHVHVRVVFKVDKEFFSKNREEFLSGVEKDITMLCNKAQGVYLRRSIDHYSFPLTEISYLLYFSNLETLKSESRNIAFHKLTREFSKVLESTL